VLRGWCGVGWVGQLEDELQIMNIFTDVKMFTKDTSFVLNFEPKL